MGLRTILFFEEDNQQPHQLNAEGITAKCLQLGGKLLCYVPTINQVEKLLTSLEEWSQIEVSESIHRTWQSRSKAIRPDTNLIGHTGFIVSARLFNK